MNPIVSAIGLVAAAVGITVSIPQVWRLWRGTTADGVSHASALLGVMAASTWLVYGTLIVDHAQMIANVPGLAGALAVLVLVLRRGGLSPVPAVAAGATWATVVTIAYSVAGPTAVGFSATCVTLVARGPQVWTVFRAPSLTALSPASFALSTLSAVLWTTYGFGSDDPPVWTSSLAVLAMSVAVLARYHVAQHQVGLPVVPAQGARPEVAGPKARPATASAVGRPVPAVPRPGGRGDRSRLTRALTP